MARIKKENTLSLENILWNCRVALRGIGSTEKNRDAVIALVFLKFAGDKFESRRKNKSRNTVRTFLLSTRFPFTPLKMFSISRRMLAGLL